MSGRHSALSLESGSITSPPIASAGAVRGLDSSLRIYGSIALSSAFIAMIAEAVGGSFSGVAVNATVILWSIILVPPLACVLASGLVLTLLFPSPAELLTFLSSVVAAILEFLT